ISIERKNLNFVRKIVAEVTKGKVDKFERKDKSLMKSQSFPSPVKKNFFWRSELFMNYDVMSKRVRVSDGRGSEGHPPCVLEARDFGGFQSTYAGESVDRTAKPWQASVAAKFDERRGKYVIDYATLGETIQMRITIPGFVQRTLAGRDESGSVGTQNEANEEALSTEAVLQWFPSPGGLPLAGILDEIIDDESCEKTIIQWGRKVLEHWARETKETGENEIFDMETMKELMSARPETFAPLVI
ncbi:hypothetical protein FOZ63_006918, partial [Perkinsus olseni]